jgi:ketosteroid isomerase-like protein
VSHENVELLLGAVALVNAGDLEAGAKLYHPDAELRDLQHPPDMPEVLHGRTAIVDALRQWLEVLHNWTIEVQEYIDADPWVVSEVQWRAVGKDSDTPIEFRAAEAFELKDGQIVRQIAGYPDMATALADLGLAPEPG